jgi:hypothetical protein
LVFFVFLYVELLFTNQFWFTSSLSFIIFITLVSRRAVLCYWVWRAGGRPHSFRTLTLVLYFGSLSNLTTWFPCGKGNYLIYFGIIRSKVKVTVNMNKCFDNRVVST